MRLISFLLFLTAFTLAAPSFSAQVLKVKGQAVLIDTAGDDIRMGKTYYLIANGKKKGIVKVVKLRPGQAIAKLLKGKALQNWTLLERTPRIARKQTAPAPALKNVSRKKKKKKPRYQSGKSKLAVGLVGGFMQNSSNVKFVDVNGATTRTDKYTGSSTSFELLADYQLHKKFYLRGSLGVHNFSAEDTSNTQCRDASNAPVVCRVDLGYMNLDIWLRYYLNSSPSYKFWVGAGLGVLFSPKYNSTTALEEDDLATTTLMQVGGGADIKLTDKLYVPLWAEYGLFPSSDTVDMNSMSVYVGLAYRL